MTTNIYIGWDTKQDIAYEVCKYSLLKTSSVPIVVKPLKLTELRSKQLYTRPIDPLSSTEFTFSRFLVPYLNNYTGWAVFCDCDFLWVDNISDLLKLKDDTKAVMVVQHDYTPNKATKMHGESQHIYPRKNWSSMVLWNCGHPSNKQVTLDMVNNETGQYLHRFSWLKDDEIGQLDHKWNWLTDWYNEPIDGKPSALHFTMGGPWINTYKDAKYSDTWRRYFEEYNSSR